MERELVRCEDDGEVKCVDADEAYDVGGLGAHETRQDKTNAIVVTPVIHDATLRPRRFKMRARRKGEVAQVA
jgi:hypothetical protein